MRNKSQFDGPAQLPEIPDAIKELYGIDTSSSRSAVRGTNPYGVNIVDDSDDTGSPKSASPTTALLTVVIAVCMFLAIFNFASNVLDRVKADLAAIDLVNSNHGMTIEEFCKNTRYEPYEYWAVFDETGKKLGERTNHDTDGVMVPTELFEYGSRRGATTSAHCHPGYSCPFSVPDLLNYAAVCLPRNITTACVVSEDYLYWLEKPADVDVNCIELYNFVVTTTKALANDPTYFDHIWLEGGTNGYASTDAYITLIADEFGLVFIKTPLD